ncbi:MAG TPA: hypothetical protein VFT12_05685 [Thermoanaerobaculia bacterium]|nr:hypothetical protein [Thermoanaerobaculia bacterium]
MARLVEWDSFDLRVDGEKLNAMVRSMIGQTEPIERIELQFHNGLLRVVGTIRKFISVPFAVDITEIHASGTTVRVPLRNASAAGFPIPTILFGLLRSRLPKELVSYEEPATLVMSLDRFLPSFIAADVNKIWIIDGGLAVTLGRGGADLPELQVPGGAHERNHNHNHTRDGERIVADD